MNVFALDFDGVICDSAVETGVSAWRAMTAVWPGWEGEEPPPDALRSFVRVRPALETGYQAPLLMHLVVRGVPVEEVLADYAQLESREMAASGASREELVDAFGTARDRWIARDSADWLARHRFYPGTIPRLREALETAPVFILTTKPERFATELLRSAGIELPDSRLFGLESGRRKEDILEELSGQPAFRDHTFHFVEDRLKTLERVVDCPALDKVRLYLATWGYCTEAEQGRAAAQPRITLWNLPDFLKLDT